MCGNCEASLAAPPWDGEVDKFDPTPYIKMSGTNHLTAGQKTPDGSSSRRNPAGNPPEKIPPVKTRGAESGPQLRDFLLPSATVSQLSTNRESYQAWIGVLAEGLSDKGKALVETEFFQHLRHVPHSTVAHSRLFSHVDLTRFDHCIHAAHSVRALNQGAGLGLTPYETTVLELVLLLHDPHRLGSHALDRVFASMPGAPEDFRSWWPDSDFHEYHGAVAAAQNPQIRQILGRYYGDVMAILTWDDGRPHERKIVDYGSLHGKLSEARLEALKRLEDELDRCSYLKLDYLRSGFASHIIAPAIADVESHEQTLSARGSGMQLNITERAGDEPFRRVAERRSVYRAELATHPVGCLAEQVIFHKGVWDKAEAERAPAELYSEAFYEDIRHKALMGRYDEMYSKDALALLEAARSGRGLSIEDVYAPLLTLTLDDFKEGGAWCELGGYVLPGIAQQYCGVPRRDMTVFESWIRMDLQRAGLDPDICLLTSNDFGKKLEYEVSRNGAKIVRETSETHCHRSLIKVIVAARAIDADGHPIDLSVVKSTVSDFIARAGCLRNPAVLDRYDPRVFCDPPTPGYFSEAIRSKTARYTPKWIELGGSGLLQTD